MMIGKASVVKHCKRAPQQSNTASVTQDKRVNRVGKGVVLCCGLAKVEPEEKREGGRTNEKTRGEDLC